MALKRFLRFRTHSRDPHEEVRQRASEYLDDDAPASLAQRIRAHLGECEDCRGFVGTLKATVVALRSLSPVGPVPSTKQRLDRIGRHGDEES